VIRRRKKEEGRRKKEEGRKLVFYRYQAIACNGKSKEYYEWEE